MMADNAPKSASEVPDVVQSVFCTDLDVTTALAGGKGDHSLRRSCFWDVSRLNEHFLVVHAILSPTSSSPSSEKDQSLDSAQPHSNPSGCLGWAVESTGQSSKADTPAFTFLIPRSGYATRDDFLQVRLDSCPGLVSMSCDLHALARFNSPLGHWPAGTVNIKAEEDLLRLAEQAAAVVRWKDLTGTASEPERQAHLATVNSELQCRLDVSWMSPGPIARKRVALVRGRPDLVTGGPVYRAAAAWGVDLVIVDDEQHWLHPDTEENKKYREAFLPTDMTEDEGVAGRIIASLKGYPEPIHGIFTLSDNFFVTVAQVATALGIPTNPIGSYGISVDKHKSRLLQDTPGLTARLTSADEMLKMVQEGSFKPSFPMIVKPTKGWSSECVSKVGCIEDLVEAVRKATGRHGGAAVVEPFFSGPEIDVNFVLQDGEILFSEIADEQPSDADAPDATADDTFSAEGLILPSALPAAEQQVAQTTMHKLLLDAGFRTGVFHVEARVVDSRCEYGRLESGLVDLVPRAVDQMPTQEAACRLLEINARPPAYRVSLTTRHTYGVDYLGAHILTAVGDMDRLALAAKAFNFGSAAAGRASTSQCWSRLLYFSAPVEGILKSEAPCEALKKRHPELAAHIVLSADYCKKGAKVALFTSGARTCIGHALISTRASRSEAMELADRVRRNFVFEVEDDAQE